VKGSSGASRDGSVEGAAAGGVRQEAGAAVDDAVLLLTPGQAAALLQVKESWLRRRAGERRVPCSFVGKHLRFSRADLEAIVAAGARPARSVGRVRPQRGGGRAGAVMGGRSPG
jgi:excisionase family DNA binding protein